MTPPFEIYQVPGMSDFTLDGDAVTGVWMQCRVCLETWQVSDLADAVQRWNEHTCLERMMS